MSLQVWLPLNGNLNNQGLNGELNVINSNVTFDNNGKIGKCANFNGTNSRISINNFSIGNNWSYGCWFYSTSTDRNWESIILLNNNGSDADTQLGFYIHTTQKRMQSTANGQYNSQIPYNYQNKWTHVFATFDGNILTTYINGIVVNTKTITASLLSRNNLVIGARSSSASGGAVGASSYFLGKINDVRIYDHCLSSKEVEEISKGLVLHYKLDSIINNKIYDCSGYGYNGTVIGAYTLEDTSSRYSYGIYMNNSGTANRIESDVEIAIPEDTLSVSFWTKFDKSKAMVIFADPKIEFAKNTNASVWLTKTSMKGFTLASFNTNEWNHIVVIHDGETYKLYVNGVSVAQNASANNWSHNSTKLYLFNRSYNNNYAATASISDFRMYATVLSDKQILELYKNSGCIDSTKNIYARELVEV